MGASMTPPRTSTPSRYLGMSHLVFLVVPTVAPSPPERSRPAVLDIPTRRRTCEWRPTVAIRRPGATQCGDLPPAGDVENGAESGGVVLDADVEVLAGGVEEAASPLRVQIVERPDPQAAVAQQVSVTAVLEARPRVVVLRPLELGLAVLVDDPVAATRLVGDVVDHVVLRRSDDQKLHLRNGRVGQRLVDRAIGDALRLAIEVSLLPAGVVAAEAHRTASQCRRVDRQVLRPVVAGRKSGA